jgi:hypothetical protein
MTPSHDFDGDHLMTRSLLVTAKLLNNPSSKHNSERSPDSDTGRRAPFPYRAGEGGRDGEEYGCSYLKDDPQDVNISKAISQRKIIGFGSAWHKNQGADDGKAQER